MHAFITAKIVISFDLRKSLRAKTCGFRDYDEQTSTKVKQDTTRFMAKRNAFCIKTGDVLYGNEMRFVSKRLPFWAKTHSILGQNALCFGPKRRAFITIRIIGQANLHLLLARHTRSKAVRSSSIYESRN